MIIGCRGLDYVPNVGDYHDPSWGIRFSTNQHHFPNENVRHILINCWLYQLNNNYSNHHNPSQAWLNMLNPGNVLTYLIKKMPIYIYIYIHIPLKIKSYLSLHRLVKSWNGLLNSHRTRAPWSLVKEAFPTSYFPKISH